jgi:cell division protein FtsQ
LKLVRYIILIVLTGLLVWGIIWARGKAADQICTGIDIEILNADSSVFVTREGILSELEKTNIRVKGKPMWQINSDRIEEALEHSEYLENVDCIKSQDGKVVVRASQLVPVLRVFDGNNSYYVNCRGKRMSATASYHVDVPVVEGHFTKKFPPTRLLPMIGYVEGDSALHALVTMYCFKDSNDIFIIPSIFGHVVNMGSADNFESKFKKLKLFYSKVLPVQGWLTYDTISVKWDHQIVATRRTKAVETAVNYDPELDEPTPDMETMSISNDKQTLAVKKGGDKEPSAPKVAEEKKDVKKDAKNDVKKDVKKDTEKSKEKTTSKRRKKPMRLQLRSQSQPIVKRKQKNK